jgi:hypothetical protein
LVCGVASQIERPFHRVSAYLRLPLLQCALTSKLSLKIAAA